MMKHLFKLIWNRKKRNFLVMVEILLSFLVLFAITVILFAGLKNYNTPLGFSYENVWLLNVNIHHGGLNNEQEQIREKFNNLMLELNNHNEIEKYSWTSSNSPYSGSTWSSSIKYGGRNSYYHVFLTDNNFLDVMDLKLLEGRWFNREDDAALINTVVINREMQEDVFENENVIGKIFSDEDDEYKIVGVVENYRYQGEFEDPFNSIFQRNILADTSSQIVSNILMKIKPGTKIEFEEKLLERLQPIFNNSRLSIRQLENKRVSYFKERILPLTVFAIVDRFLVFNVALGLYGILWLSINKRRKEIGVRRAFGANATLMTPQRTCEYQSLMIVP